MNHELKDKSALHLGDVLHYPFVGLMQYHSLQQSIETQAKLLGCAIQYRLRLPNFAAIAQVVANGGRHCDYAETRCQSLKDGLCISSY